MKKMSRNVKKYFELFKKGLMLILLTAMALPFSMFLELINVKEENIVKAENVKYEYAYTGTYQVFEAPETGTYKMELWGAQGGGSRVNNGLNNYGGFGAYTAGLITLEKGQKLYIYVGGAGANAIKSRVVAGGWNGGGSGNYDHSDDEAGGGGGGATDIRLVPTSATNIWNEYDSLASRIMVAAGGGGSAEGVRGGAGGTLASFDTHHIAGSTQTSGASFGKGADGVYRYSNKDEAGGGGGYYGGRTMTASGDYYGEGAGGSSFVSGFEGSDAIDSVSTSENIIHTGQSIHYSGFEFEFATMISGGGYVESPLDGTLRQELMPTPTGETFDANTGKTGNGYAIIEHMVEMTPDDFPNYKYGDGTDFMYYYTGGYQTFVAPYDGVYRLEAWGARGGAGMRNSSLTYRGGYGGYASGEIHLNKGDTFYIYVGQAGYNGRANCRYCGGYGGWNGGAKGGNDSNHDGSPDEGGGGGGATDFRLIPTSETNVWNEFESLKSRVIIAAGGGGGVYGGYGQAGGLYLNQTNTYQFGLGQSGFAATSGSGGGGGGYFGGASQQCDGCLGFGGTSYVSGSADDLAITAGSIAGSITLASDSIHNSGMTFNNPTKINGNTAMPSTSVSGTMTGNPGHGVARVTILSIDESVPKLSSLDVQSGTFNQTFNQDTFEYDVDVNSENYKVNVTATPLKPQFEIFRGLGEITLKAGVNIHYVGVVSETGQVTLYRTNIYRPPSSYPYLQDIKVDGVSIPGFSPTKLTYDVPLPDTTEKVDLDAILGRPSQTVSGLGEVEVSFGTTTRTIDVVSEDGNTITTYTINFKKSNTTKLKSLAPENYALSPEFNPDTFAYKISVPSAVLSLDVEAIPLDPGSTVKITGNGYLKSGVNNRITITVSQPGLADSVYIIDVEREGIVPNPVFDFTCTQSIQEFVAPGSGYYKLEAWGAQGGYAHTNYRHVRRGGYGGYTAGTIWLNKGEVIYVTVGCKGANAANTGRYNGGTGGYNGGARGGHDKNHDSAPDAGGGGGGATDFRLVGGTNTDFASLKTRILVAGGGGGGVYGANGQAGNSNINNVGGYSLLNGQIGFPATAGGGGGAGGYFGGISPQYDGAIGYGGTSYVYGVEGYLNLTQEATISSPTLTADLNPDMKIGDREVQFKDVEVYNGNESMPSKTSGYSTGNAGDGYARITLLPMPSQNNYLEQLTVTINGEVRTYTPVLNREDLDYYLPKVDTTETEALISARPEDSTAKITGLGEVDIPAGDNVYPIEVTAENGDVRTYNVHISRDPNTNEYPIDIIINGLVPSLCSVESELDLCNLQPAQFDQDTHDYYLIVPSRIKQLWFDVEKGHKYQVVSGDGKVSLKGGENVITITVTSEAGAVDGSGQPSSVYRYHVTRDMTGNTDLSPLKVLDSGPKEVLNDDGTVKKDENGNPIIDYGFDLHFDPDVLEYYLTIPNSYEDYVDLAEDKRDTSITDKLQLYMKTDDENASYSIIPANPANFATGMNDLNILVTAANGETRTYILHVYREQNENTYISSLEVKNGTTNYPILPVFSKANLGPYNVTVPNDIDNVDIIATAEVSTTHIEGTGNKTLNTGLNKFELVSVAENGTKEKYLVYITREKNSNPNLTDIKVTANDTDYALDPVFNKDTLEYNVTLPQGITSVSITATPEVSTTKYKLLDSKTIKLGANKKRVVGIAEDGTTKTYVLNITRPASSNNYLTDITLSSGTLDPVFNREGVGKKDENGDDIGFQVVVPNSVTSITINGIKEDPLATVKGNGKYSLAVGSNEITLKVIAEDGATRTYLINVIREPNANPYLKAISTNKGTIAPTPFDKEETSYTINIDSTVDSLEITATAEVNTTFVNGTKGGIKAHKITNIPIGTSTFTITTLAEDGVSTMTYTLTIIKDKSDNVNASLIRLKEANIDPLFAKDVVFYEAYVPNSVTSGNFIVKPEYPNATYEIMVDSSSPLTVNGDTVEGLVVGENTVTIRIKGETGDPENYKDYTVVIVRQEPSAYSDYLASLTVSPGTLTPTFDKNTMYYEVEVPYTTKSVNVSATAEDSSSKVMGTGTYTLNVGENQATVIVMTTDGFTREYQIVITRQPSDEARLSAMSINNAMITPGFNRDVTEYTATTSDTSLDFSKITTLDSAATYEVLYNKFQTGDVGHIVTIRVTAPNGVTTKDYNITIIKEKNSNNNLADLGVVDYNISPAFNKTTTLYKVTVPNDINSVAIYATPEVETSTVTGTGSFALNVGENQFVVEVTSEAGTVKAYTILVTKEGNDDNNLTSLVVNNGVMTPSFDGRTTYDVVVPYEETELDLTVVLSDPNASYRVENNKLNEGSNVVSVIVKAENGAEKTYTLNVTRKPIVSALLKDIKVKNYHLTPVFNGNVMSYDILVDNEVTQLDLTIIPLDKNATWKIVGNESFAIGLNTVTIEVTASDGVTKETYTLNVTRQAYSNSFLDYLYTSEGDVTPLFNKTTMEYSINVKNSVKQIELFCEAVDASATVTGCSSDTTSLVHELQTGENVIPITVTTTSGVKRTYYVTVNREKDNNNKLLTLEVKRGTTIYALDPEFSATHNKYDVTVPAGTPNVTISATADSLVNITGLGTKTLVAGDNVFNVVATAESGESNIYIITVHREISTNNFLTDLVPSVGNLEPSFTYTGTEYTLNLDSSASLLSFTYTTEDAGATVTGWESQVIPDGKSTREIIVTAEDGVSQRKYTITVNKERSDNANLMLLSVNGYPFVETFDPSVYEYHVVFPNTKTTLLQSEVIAVAQDKNAKVTKSPNMTLVTDGENEYIVKVTAPDGFTTQTYKIIATRQQGSNSTAMTLRVNKGYLTKGFNPNVYEYEWKLPKSVKVVTKDLVTVVPADKNATIIMTESIDMESEADKVFVVRIVAEDGSGYTEYILNITYDLSTVATLGSLVIDKGFYLPEFNPNTLVYDAYEYIDVNEVNVTATPDSEFAQVISGNGPVTLNDELTVHTIVVQSESGATETYTIKFHKTILKDQGLLNLGLNGLDNLDCINGRCVLDPTFKTDVLEYSIQVPYEYENLDVLIEKMNEQQTVKLKIGEDYIDDYTLPVGKTELFVEVYDGMGKHTRTYKMTIERCKSTNNYLKELSIKDYPFTETFDKTVMEYTINVGHDIDEIPLDTITAIPEDPGAIVGQINGYNYLMPGNNDITIPVYAADGSERIYIIHVVKYSEFSSYIRNITVSTGVFWDLTPKFKQTTYDYTTTVDSMYSKATVEAIPALPNTKIEGTGEYDLVTGVNVVTLTAYATDDDGNVLVDESGNPKSKSVYTVRIIKKESTDVDLINLIVEEGTLLKADTLQPGFDKTITKYVVNVPATIDKVTVIPTLSDKTSTYKILGNDKLKSGENIVSVIVYNSTKTASKTYQIIVNRAKDDIKTLNSLEVVNTDDNTIKYPFVPEFKMDHAGPYDVVMPYNIEKVNVVATATSPNAFVVGDGVTYLEYGLNHKTVMVTAESGDVQTYNLNLYREYNLNLKSLTSDIGTLVKKDTNEEGFAPNVTDYIIEVDKDTNKIVFIAQPESNKVTVEGNGEYTLVPGDNQIEFKVKSPDGHEKIYTVIVKKAKDANNYIAELMVDGLMSPVYDKETTSYDVNVRESITTGEVPNLVTTETTKLGIQKVKLESRNATCKIVGPAELINTVAEDVDCTLEASGTLTGVDTKNEVKIVVTAQTGDIKEYILNVYRRDSSFFSNRITALKITTIVGSETINVPYNPDFNPDHNNYAATVANSITAVSIEFTREDEYSTYEIFKDNVSYGQSGNNIPLHPGRNAISIVVTSSDGLVKNTYLIVVYRTESSDATLKSLTTTGHSYSPIFSSQTTQYTMEVPGTLESLPVVAVPNDPNATVTISGNNFLQDGENTVTIHVVAPDGITMKDYYITINKVKSDNNFLTNLEVVDYPFSIPFEKNNQGPYVVNVPNDVTNIVIRATTEDPNATITGDGLQQLTTGENVFPVDIEAPNGDYRTYTIIVNKAASTDSSLKDIILSDGTLDPIFNPGILYYEVLVPEELEQITVTGVVNDPLSTVEGNGVYQIEDLETEIKLVVTSEDGNKTTYTVKVIRDVESLSTLKELILKDGELYPRFHKLITSYTILVPYEVRNFKMDSEPFNMIYTPEDPEATVVVTGNTNFRIGSNTMKITVTSKDGKSTTEYDVSVVRQSAASNYLRSLEVKSTDEKITYKMHPVFSKDTLYYEVTVPKETEAIKIKASLDDLTSTLSGTGTKYLNVGLNRFYVTVESASGVIRSYQLVINRSESTENKLLTLTHDVGTIDPIFNPEVKDYVITVPEKTTKITLDGTASENSTIVGLGTFQVIPGEQTKLITVTSQSGENNIYTIKIVRPASSNTNLISLTPSIGTIDFNNDTDSYTMEVDDNASVISFSAVPEDQDATITGLNLTQLNYGENDVTITVTAEDGVTTRTINIKIMKNKGLNAIIASEEDILLGVDEYLDVQYTLDPVDTSETSVVWRSNDEQIATVDQNGRITGKKLGSTQVLVMSATNNEIYDTIVVNVINKHITSQVYEINRFENTEGSEEVQEEKISHAIGIEPSTTLEDFLPNFDNDPLTLHVYDINGNELTDSEIIIASFMKIKLIIKDTVLDELSIIVRGDLNGDGYVTVTDYVKMKNYFLGKVDLNYLENCAAELSNDEYVTVTDYVKMKNYFLGKITTLN